MADSRQRTTDRGINCHASSVLYNMNVVNLFFTECFLLHIKCSYSTYDSLYITIEWVIMVVLIF